MKKFIVIVNQKTLVSVEAESNGGAEHQLINIFGVNSALAFDAETEAGLDFYRGYIATCETASLDEIKAKSNAAIASVYEIHNEMMEEVDHYEYEINRLKEKLAAVEANLSDAKNNKREFENKMGSKGVKLQGYTAKEKIEALKK